MATVLVDVHAILFLQVECPDDQCIMTYVACFRPVEEALADPQTSYIKG